MKRLILLAFAITFNTVAGPSTSGGGFAVVCRDAAGKIQKAELLDLYEAREVYGLQIMPNSGDLVRNYIRATSNGYRLQGFNPPVTQEQMAENVQKFMNISKWLAPDEKLPILGDIGLTVKVPSDCQVEPLAIFYDIPNNVIIDKQIWSALDGRSQAALIIHEIVYHYFRQMKMNPDVYSIDARALTATFFSTNTIPVKTGIPSNLVPNTFYSRCDKSQITNTSSITSCSEATVVYRVPTGVYPDGSLKYRLQFTYLAGRPLLAMTTVDVPRDVKLNYPLPINGSQVKGWSAQFERSTIPGVEYDLVIERSDFLMVRMPLKN